MTHEYVSVRKDILEAMYKAIDEYTEQISELPSSEWRFGKVIMLRDELEAGKTYEEISALKNSL